MMMEEKIKLPEVQQSGVIVFDSAVCNGCGICELMCSLYHEGVGGPALSRAKIDRDPFSAEFTFHSCRQCLAPSCYMACPLRDEAIRICEDTGARYVNEIECIGCGECVAACPFDPPAIAVDEEKGIAFKCDLCRGRTSGPICIEYCPVGALTYVPAKER